MSSPVAYRSFKIRVACRHQRPLYQLAKEPPQPDPADGDRPDKIEPADDKSARLKSRRDTVARPDNGNERSAAIWVVDRGDF